MGVAEAKERLRERMREARRAIPPADRRRLASLVERRLEELPEIGAAETVLLFYSFGSEIETRRIVTRLHDRGIRLLLPYLEEGGMEAAEVRAGDDLVSSSYGPKEPSRRVAVDPAEIDVVVAPGLAFDPRGRRLGYGGGHYDRYLRRLGPGAFRVGIGFEIQLVDRLPAEPRDEGLDAVVTDRRVIRVRS